MSLESIMTLSTASYYANERNKAKILFDGALDTLSKRIWLQTTEEFAKASKKLIEELNQEEKYEVKIQQIRIIREISPAERNYLIVKNETIKIAINKSIRNFPHVIRTKTLLFTEAQQQAKMWLNEMEKVFGKNAGTKMFDSINYILSKQRKQKRPHERNFKTFARGTSGWESRLSEAHAFELLWNECMK
jgi:hypothetical protein